MGIDFQGVLTIIAIAKLVQKYPEQSVIELAMTVCNALSFIADYTAEDKADLVKKAEAFKEFSRILEL